MGSIPEQVKRGRKEGKRLSQRGRGPPTAQPSHFWRRSAALAAVGKGEAACGHAVLIEVGRRAANRANRGYGWFQKVEMEMKKPR